MDICWDYMEVTENKEDNPSNSTQEGAPAISALDAEVDKREEIISYRSLDGQSPKGFMGVPLYLLKK